MNPPRSFLNPALALLVLVAALAVSASAAERLDRGVVALPRDDGAVYIGWRLLAGEPPGTAFDVYRSASPAADAARAEKLNAQPITDSCNYLDRSPVDQRGYYFVAAVGQDRASPARAGAQVAPERHLTLKLRENVRAQKVGLCDFDGDGRLDYLVKHPDFNTDPYQQPGYWKRSEGTYKLDAFRHNGEFLWRYDMGWAIEEGIWYSPIVVYDLDGDGRAEVFCKAGEGDPREPTGHVNTGAEHLVMLDGLTGQVKKRLDWIPRDGFEQYNYWSRNLLGIAYLDGRNPHLVVQRGTYRLIKVRTYDPLLQLKWEWEATGPYQRYRGQGMHGMHAADIDDDSRDEIILGSAALDDDGKGLWATGKGHPDVCYVADINPARPGLEIFHGIEPGRQSNTVSLVEARTGKLIWGSPEITVHVHGQGMVGDIDPAHPGMECYAGESKGGSNYWLYSAEGRRLSDQSLGDLSPKAIYWLDGTNKVYVVGETIYRWPREKVGSIQGRIVAIADCIGDWREELITSLNGEIRIYSTTVPATSRRVCLMQDRLYRTDVAMQTMGYFYPPQLGGTSLTP